VTGVVAGGFAGILALIVCGVGFALAAGIFAAIVDGPWWRPGPIPGQYWTLPGLGPVKITDTNYRIQFSSVHGETAAMDEKAFRWQATLTTREAFEVAVARERVLKGGAP